MKDSAAETMAASEPGGVPDSWKALLEAYREGPRPKWSPLLVARLGPWLGAARQQLHAVPPYLDREDVSQQLVLEVLSIASRWRPVCEDRWIPRRLVERAARKVLRSLLAEKLDQTVELGFDVAATETAEPELGVDTPLGKASVADLQVIYRADVLGEPIEALADEAGLKPEQMRRRLKSLRARARASSDSARG
jgi:hypothetical protein